jgi:hypothetical protein
MAYGISAINIRTGKRERFGFFESKYEAIEYIKDFKRFGNDRKVPYKSLRPVKLKEKYY